MNGHRLKVVARSACERAGLGTVDLITVKVAENAIYRVPSRGVVVRVARPGQREAAEREVLVASWLRSADVPAVEPADQAIVFVMVADHPVTFWKELPSHRGGTTTEIAVALRRLHALDPPPFLSVVDPFVRLEQRIDAARTLSDEDQQWLRQHLATLNERWSRRSTGMQWGPIHGDAWEGNVVTTEDGTTVFLDLERTSIGPPEWDLTSTAIKSSSFGWTQPGVYAGFAKAYGHDVTTWAGFPLFRDIREMRMTCMAVQSAASNDQLAEQAQWRVDCLRDRRGSRPWSGWEPIP